MRLGLTNTIAARGTPVGGDGLALDLQFAADKTLTARKGPTPVFTRASSGTFVGSNGLIQSAGNNVARFDHDPVTLASRGLLIEESRTNLWTASEDLGSSPWITINTTTLNSNNTTSPNGLTTADRFTVGSTTQEYGFFRNTFSFVSGTTYTISCYFKADQVTRVSIYSTTQATLPVDAYFDLTGNGSITANAAGTASIQRLANGWYRCAITGTALASAITSVRINAATTANSRNYPGNSVDSFWAWGAQLETGSFPTSYIPTTTASVVRSADVCSISGAAFSGFYNATEGTSFISAIKNTNTGNLGNPRFLSITNGTSGNRMEIQRGVTQEQIAYYAGGSFLHELNLGSVAVGVNCRIAQAMAANNFAASRDGLTPVTNNSSIMLAADRMIIGANFNASTNFFNGTISAIRYYRKRLANAKLQSLTA